MRATPALPEPRVIASGDVEELTRVGSEVFSPHRLTYRGKVAHLGAVPVDDAVLVSMRYCGDSTVATTEELGLRVLADLPGRQAVDDRTDPTAQQRDAAGHDEGEVLAADAAHQVGEHGVGDLTVEGRVEDGCGGDRHRGRGQRTVADPARDLLAAEQAHDQGGPDAQVTDVVAAQVRDGRDHPHLDHSDAGEVRRDGHRQRGHAADVRDEALGGREPDVVGDHRVDGVVDRPAVLQQVLRRDGPGPGNTGVAVDGDLEHAAQGTARGRRPHAARDGTDPSRDGATDLLCSGHPAPDSLSSRSDLGRTQRTWRRRRRV